MQAMWSAALTGFAAALVVLAFEEARQYVEAQSGLQRYMVGVDEPRLRLRERPVPASYIDNEIVRFNQFPLFDCYSPLGFHSSWSIKDDDLTRIQLSHPGRVVAVGRQRTQRELFHGIFLSIVFSVN